MAPNRVILLACGSFNPPTNMHLRMFELARDNLNQLGNYLVVGGIVSPVHESYGKKELIPAMYRCEMLKLALKSSDWIQISDWECSQETWSRTKRVLQYHQNLLNSVLSDQRDSPNNNQRSDLENGYEYNNWITNEIRNSEGPVQIKLLCGADLLESFATPGLWADEDIETIIGQHGIVVITRQGFDPRRFIYESDILTKYQRNIIIVTEWITNDVSSTKVRRALRRQESVKYLLGDSVIEFIKKHELYGARKTDSKYNPNAKGNLSVPVDTFILTPSPSDSNVKSGNDIILSLNPLLSEKSRDVITLPLSRPADENSTVKNFQSTEEMEFLSRKEKSCGGRNDSRGFQYPGEAVPVGCAEIVRSPEQRKKVGFTKAETVSGGNVAEGESRSDREIDSGKEQGGSSKKHANWRERKKTKKSEGEKNEEGEIRKGNIILRRTKSDAVMSRKSQIGETVSVKIRFTKDGVKARKSTKSFKSRKKIIDGSINRRKI